VTEFGCRYSFESEHAEAVAEEMLSRYPMTLFVKPQHPECAADHAGQFLRFLEHERGWLRRWNPETQGSTFKMDVDDSEEDDFLEFLRGCASEEFLTRQSRSMYQRSGGGVE